MIEILITLSKITFVIILFVILAVLFAKFIMFIMDSFKSKKKNMIFSGKAERFNENDKQRTILHV